MQEGTGRDEKAPTLREAYAAVDRSDLMRKAYYKVSLWLQDHPRFFGTYGFSLRVKKLALEPIATAALEEANEKGIGDAELDAYLDEYIEAHYEDANGRAEEIRRTDV